MKREKWNRDWYFTKGGANLVQYGSRIQAPHDYMIGEDVREDAPAGAAMGYFTGTVGTYTKFLDAPGEWEGERVYLHFDGVMMNAAVSVNGSLVKRHHYGYTPFSADITDALYFGERNRITVTVNPSMQPNSRWYTGAGLYRTVELSHVGPLHIEPEGIFAYTKRITFPEKRTEDRPDRAEDAFLTVEVTVRSHLPQDHQVRVRALLAPEGLGEDSPAPTVRESVVLVPAGGTAVARIPMTVLDPLLWDAEHPNLCLVKAQLEDMGAFGVGLDRTKAHPGVCDEAQTLFGIRTVTADAVHGLLINGRTVKLRGGCIHHDNGILGAVSLYDSEYRRLRLMKEAGFNAVRLAHNPGSRELLEACDRLGLYVVDEAFDAWGHSKQPGDYSQFFRECWKEDMEAFLLRDRNHPSVIFWSTGNEVEERGGMGDGYRLAQELAAFVRSMDPTRLVTNGLCSMWSGLDDKNALAQMRRSLEQAQGNVQNVDFGKNDASWEERTEAFCSCLDVVGYNYMDDHYEYAAKRYPERVILGTESFPGNIDQVWALVERLPGVIGDCTWTAVDYIGEAGIGKSVFLTPDDPRLAQGAAAAPSHASEYPWRLANDADITITGSRTPQGVYRRIVWGSAETGLFVQDPAEYGKTEIVSSWGWNQISDCWSYEAYRGKPVKVYVYSAAQEVELLVNERSVGRKAAGSKNRFTAVFDVTYEPGVLTAVSFDGEREISRREISTTGEAAAIRLTADRTCLRADGENLAFVTVELVDEAGRVVKTGQTNLTAQLQRTEVESAVTDPIREMLSDEKSRDIAAAFGISSESQEPEYCASLAGFGSDAPITQDNYTAGTCGSWQGRALAVVRAGYVPGKAVLRVSAPQLGSAEVEITVE